MIERQSLVQRVKALAEALEGSEVGELDLTENGLRIAIKRQLEAPIIAQMMAAPMAPAPMRRSGSSASRPARRPTSGRARGDVAGAAPAENPGVAIAAPLTGVYYSSPSPSSPQFVQMGETVQAGQVVCIVEAMKVFNEIKSEVSGVVSAMIANNGQLVQKGDPLIRVKPI
ncbi:MAG TPA: acetyl-CoA carboxylase biotin carboxyl carrier protein [Ktedonobacterales bacterium]|nr:acetyl-CoA carboxylase biotin carboxyl carrier protein [Ktedonobacterales bacterium]